MAFVSNIINDNVSKFLLKRVKKSVIRVYDKFKKNLHKQMSIFEHTLSIDSSLNKARVSEGLGAEDKRISVNQQGRGMGACLAGFFFFKNLGGGGGRWLKPRPPPQPFPLCGPCSKALTKKITF